MELGAFSIVEPHVGRAEGERFDDLLRLAESAERAGLTSFWVGEHHFQESGLCPSPPIVLAAAGQRTSGIRLGSLVCVLPFHRAVDVAEEYALLDVLLHGRLNLGVGSGYIPVELEGFGIPAAAKRERFDRALLDLCSALEGREIRIDGGPPVRINVRSPQVPRPPIWVAVQQRESVAAIARRGLSMALLPYATFGDLSELAAAIQEYRRALPPGVPGRVSVALPVYVGEDRTAAIRALDQHLHSRAATITGYYEGGVRRGPPNVSARGVENAGFALLGSAHEVGDAMAELAQIGVDDLLGMFDLGALPASQVLLSVRRAAAARSPAWVGAGAGGIPPIAAGR